AFLDSSDLPRRLRRRLRRRHARVLGRPRRFLTLRQQIPARGRARRRGEQDVDDAQHHRLPRRGALRGQPGDQAGRRRRLGLAVPAAAGRRQHLRPGDREPRRLGQRHGQGRVRAAGLRFADPLGHGEEGPGPAPPGGRCFGLDAVQRRYLDRHLLRPLERDNNGPCVKVAEPCW
ncbi:hypothetical protein LX36DRAFT_747427, partial [Colletotrichum falcatum]